MPNYYELTYRSKRASGDRTVLELPWVPDCEITKIVFLQTGGAPTAFSFRLYSRAEAVSDSSQSSGGDDPAGDYWGDKDNYQVGSLFEQNNIGQTFNYSGTGIKYLNRDGAGCDKQRKIYVELETPGAGDTAFDITLGGVLP